MEFRADAGIQEAEFTEDVYKRQLQMGLCMGVQPLMAYYYGAGDMRRIKEVVMKLFILTLGIGVVFGAVGMLGSKALVGLFIRDLEVVELGPVSYTHLFLWFTELLPFTHWTKRNSSGSGGSRDHTDGL